MLTLLCLNTGCAILGGSDSSGPSYNFPGDITSECYGARNNAKNCILSVGTPLPSERGCMVTKVAGERLFDQDGEMMWGWKYNDLWVLGLYHNRRIWVGSNPETGKETNELVLAHEFGHYWLDTNFYFVGHDKKYSTCFHNWRDRDSYTFDINSGMSIEEQAETASRSLKKGTIVTLVGQDDDGNFIYIHGIVDND